MHLSKHFLLFRYRTFFIQLLAWPIQEFSKLRLALLRIETIQDSSPDMTKYLVGILKTANSSIVTTACHPLYFDQLFNLQSAVCPLE